MAPHAGASRDWSREIVRLTREAAEHKRLVGFHKRQLQATLTALNALKCRAMGIGVVTVPCERKD